MPLKRYKQFHSVKVNLRESIFSCINDFIFSTDLQRTTSLQGLNYKINKSSVI